MIRGIHPTRAEAAPTGPAQKRDNGTHRLVKAHERAVTDRGLRRCRAAKGRLSVSLRGRRLATDKGHRVDTDLEA